MSDFRRMPFPPVLVVVLEVAEEVDDKVEAVAVEVVDGGMEFLLPWVFKIFKAHKRNKLL